jgi:hypothetical protein
MCIMDTLIFLVLVAKKLINFFYYIYTGAKNL